MSRIRIVSDGHYMRSAVYTVADDGTEEMLNGVLGVTWSLKTGEVAQATLDLDMVGVDVVGYDEPPECGYESPYLAHPCFLPADHDGDHCCYAPAPGDIHYVVAT